MNSTLSSPLNTTLGTNITLPYTYTLSNWSTTANPEYNIIKYDYKIRIVNNGLILDSDNGDVHVFANLDDLFVFLKGLNDKTGT